MSKMSLQTTVEMTSFCTKYRCMESAWGSNRLETHLGSLSAEELKSRTFDFDS
jgi:hypothetical protein